MSAIFRRDANSTSNVQQYEENLSATAYKSLILLLRYLHVAEDEGVFNKVKSIVGDATPYRAEMKKKRFVEQLICPERRIGQCAFRKTPNYKWRNTKTDRVARNKLAMRFSHTD